MRLVVALGGNALLPRRGRLDFDVQQRAAAAAADALGPILVEHEAVITHGNGPQVGLLALQAAAYREVPSYPLDVLIAQSEGMIGYILETELDRVVDRPIVTVLTRTLVDERDPAFFNPTKPIGPLFENEAVARKSASEMGWVVKADGTGFRRVVASPRPLRILNREIVGSLMEAGVLVICAGGGGIPVTAAREHLRGVEAVVDKDFASSLLAVELEADTLLCLTDVDGVYENWGRADQSIVRTASTAWLRSRHYPAGSMGPKVEACCRFAEATGRPAAIGRLDQAGEILAGSAGTRVEPVAPGQPSETVDGRSSIGTFGPTDRISRPVASPS